MNKLIVIPARGGSKGIPGKNIYPLNGKPLLEYTLDVIESASLKNVDVVVSTDSIDIKRVAEAYKNIYIVDRPKDISGDTSSTEDALIHALKDMEKRLNQKYDAILTLQATSPLRAPTTLEKFIETFESNYPEYDALLSLSESNSDYWVSTYENTYERLYKDAPRRRQERKPIYVENSAYYITSTKSLLETHSVLGHHVNGFVISNVEGIDINEPIDLLIAKCFLDEKDVKEQRLLLL